MKKINFLKILKWYSAILFSYGVLVSLIYGFSGRIICFDSFSNLTGIVLDLPILYLLWKIILEGKGGDQEV